MAILARDGNVSRIGDEPITGLDRLEMGTKVVRKLIQDDLPLLRFILTPGGFAMKHRFAIRDQRGELIIQPNQMAGSLAKA